MYMASLPARWTAEMVRELPEDRNRYEVIDGDLLVSPGPTWTHQEAVAALLVRLRPWLSANRLGIVMDGPADIEFADDTLVQPDLFVVPLVSGRVPRCWEDVKSLLLVVEVLSPSTARFDKLSKRLLYLREGAPEYWVIDMDARLIERWFAGMVGPEVASASVEWQPAGARSPFVLDVSEYFAEVLDR